MTGVSRGHSTILLCFEVTLPEVSQWGRALGWQQYVAWGLQGLRCLRDLCSGSHLIPYSLFTQETDQHEQGRNQVTELFCGLRSALISDSGRNVQTTENNQGEVAWEMKINLEGFFMHTQSLESLEFRKGDMVASKRRQDNLLREEENNATEIQWIFIYPTIQKKAVSRCLDWTHPRGRKQYRKKSRPNRK